jgi:hypothetical protein
VLDGRISSPRKEKENKNKTPKNKQKTNKNYLFCTIFKIENVEGGITYSALTECSISRLKI